MEGEITMAEKKEKKETLIGMACEVFQGPMKAWAYLAMLFGLIATVIFFYSGWQFWIAETVNAHFHWAVAVLLSALFIAMLKIWFWMLMMRNSIVRALKK